MPHLFSPALRAAPADWRLSAMLRQPRLFIPIMMVLISLSWMIAQSVHDYRNTKFKAGERVSIAAYLVADRLDNMISTGRQVAGIAMLARSSSTPEQWRRHGVDEIRKLRSLVQETLPDLEIAVYDVGDRTLLNSNPVLYDTLSNQLERQRAQLAMSDKNMLIQFVPSQSLSGNFLVSQSYRDASGTLRYVVQLIMPTYTLATILQESLFARDAAMLLTDADNRLIVRVPATGSFVAGQRVPATDKSSPGFQTNVYIVYSRFEHDTRIIAERKVLLPFSGSEMVLTASISWSAYKASWLNSLLINIVISTLLLLGLAAYCYDCLRDLRHRQMLTQSIMRQQNLLQRIPIAVAVVNTVDGRIRFSNPVMREQFGSLAAEAEPLSNLFHKTVDWRTVGQASDAPVPMLGRNGQMYMQVSRSEMAVPDQTGSIGIVLTFLDVTERYLHEQKLLTAATTDALTGLANRRQFDHMAERMIAATRAAGKPLWVLILDLDHFKRVNDTYGHDAGDLVLQQAARLLQGAMRSGDMAARLGGEEFGALLSAVTQEQAHAMAERVRQVIAGASVHLADGRVLTVTASIGLAMLQSDDPDIYAVLKRADQALYAAKESGRNRIVISSSVPEVQA